MAADPEQDLITRIDAQVSWANKSGASQNIFAGKPQPPNASVQIIVRGAVNGRPANRADTDEIRGALHHQTLTADYDDVELLQEPLYIGEDEAGRSMHSINLRMLFEE